MILDNHFCTSCFNKQLNVFDGIYFNITGYVLCFYVPRSVFLYLTLHLYRTLRDHKHMSKIRIKHNSQLQNVLLILTAICGSIPEIKTQSKDSSFETFNSSIFPRLSWWRITLSSLAFYEREVLGIITKPLFHDALSKWTTEKKKQTSLSWWYLNRCIVICITDSDTNLKTTSPFQVTTST